MDNATRSERTRAAAIQAALTIIARDGPGKLTLDAIAKEGGISKGGLMHQFRTKQAVLQALLGYQIAYSEQVTRDQMAKLDPAAGEVHLRAQIETLREMATDPKSVAVALVGAMVEEPGLLSLVRAETAPRLALIKAEATNPDLAMLRWVAARGLAVTALFGMCPLSEAERQHLFDLLRDGRLCDGAREGAPL